MKRKVFLENIDEEDVKVADRRMTRSMTNVERTELEQDRISTFWMKIENAESFDDVAIYTVEVLVKDIKSPEVITAQEK